MLADCLDLEETMDFNKFSGANNYIDPLTQIFCVRFNNAPLMGDYWVEKKELESTDIEDFTLSPFRQAVEGSNEVPANTDTTIYQMGDQMLA